MLRAIALGLMFLVLVQPTNAQEPGEATLTIGEETLFLYADNTASAVPMITHDGDTLHLTFAEIYLGFPLPPFLHLTLQNAPDGWQVTHFAFERSDNSAPLVAGPLQITSAELSEFASFTITGMGVTQINGSTNAVPLHLIISVPLPP